MYHAVTRVEADPDRICVSPEQFQDQVAFLKHLGLRGVSVQELLRAMGQGEAKGLVGFTFDDGYANFSQDVLPVLERYGFTATVFVVVGMLGKENSWMHKPRLHLLSARDLGALVERGIEVGSHGMNHIRLSGDLEPELLAHEINDSREILTEVVGKEVKGFCCPFGGIDDTVAEIVRRTGYTYSCGGLLGTGDLFLPRIFIGNKDGPLRMSIKLAGHMLYARYERVLRSKYVLGLLRTFLSRLWFGR